MKSLISSTIVLILILLLWGALYFFTDVTTDKLKSSMQDVYDNTMQEDWDAAKSSNETFISELSAYKKLYSVYMEGVSIHDIELSAQRCLGYIEAHDRSLSAGEAASILKHLEHLVENGLLSVDNVI